MSNRSLASSLRRGHRLVAGVSIYALLLTNAFGQSAEPRQGTTGSNATTAARPPGQQIRYSPEGKYVRKESPDDFLELTADGKCTLQQNGHRISGTYRLLGETLIFRSPAMPVPAHATFASQDTIIDQDNLIWERVQPFTNQDVVNLSALGLGDDIVIAKIKTAPNVRFNVETDALMSLKTAKVTSPVIAAMIERAAHPAVTPAAPPPVVTTSEVTSTSAGAPAPAKHDPCEGVELLGLYKDDMRPVSPLIIYFAKVRNGAGVARIVTFKWRDMYAEEKAATIQLGAGQIATQRLEVQQPFERQPIELRITSCE